jgi:sulfite reductase alpha subunit-like flavoprotein
MQADFCTELINAPIKIDQQMSNRPLTILYGSQTGCAEEVAERIAREAKRRLFTTTLSSMDSYDVPLQNLTLGEHSRGIYNNICL